MSVAKISLRDVYKARQTIRPSVQRTPLKLSSALSERTDASVYLKLETVHDTGALKLRGAAYRILNLSAVERSRGVMVPLILKALYGWFVLRAIVSRLTCAPIHVVSIFPYLVFYHVFVHIWELFCEVIHESFFLL